MTKDLVQALFTSGSYTAALSHTGIGAAICQRLANEGARVLVADINERAAAATCNDVNIAENGDSCISCQVS